MGCRASVHVHPSGQSITSGCPAFLQKNKVTTTTTVSDLGATSKEKCKDDGNDEDARSRVGSIAAMSTDTNDGEKMSISTYGECPRART